MSKKNRNGNGNGNNEQPTDNTNEEPTKVKKFRKAGLYVILFGACANNETGEILPFNKKKDLDSWLLANEIKEHDNPEMAEQKFLQISDGRVCLINYGLIKGVRIVVKKKMTV